LIISHREVERSGAMLICLILGHWPCSWFKVSSVLSAGF
jgi:hypothetical protein